MSKDVRVILIKLADRLHNMRTLDAMPPEKQLKIASETSYFYVPFAHRLGLYSIKSELEDYAMRYTNPTEYFTIADKLKDSEKERLTLIPEFVAPIKEAIEKVGIHAEITSRTKSVASIYNKMLRKQINFEDVYDIFAVRFVFDSPVDQEFDICWRIYHIICSLYQTNPTRDRNFLTHPKPNGYQSLHVTAMSKTGRWIEVQIRSKRMDEIAEKGLAAHYRYKDDDEIEDKDISNRLESWLAKTREILDSKDADALDFLSEVRLNLGLKEIYVFTPKGDMKPSLKVPPCSILPTHCIHISATIASAPKSTITSLLSIKCSTMVTRLRLSRLRNSSLKANGSSSCRPPKPVAASRISSETNRTN